MNRIALTLAVLLGLAACAPRGGNVPAEPFNTDRHEPSPSQGVFPGGDPAPAE